VTCLFRHVLQLLKDERTAACNRCAQCQHVWSHMFAICCLLVDLQPGLGAWLRCILLVFFTISHVSGSTCALPSLPRAHCIC
jgi:hypothetical protein